MNYYNEIDTDAADWLEDLIRQGEIPPGGGRSSRHKGHSSE